ncbi:MAG TPA: hypothetical protein VMS02_05525 [Solirubrobacteraceae bacterium]|nr:hypothetical protein [Solirubrobacteraceae bacterium]
MATPSEEPQPEPAEPSPSADPGPIAEPERWGPLLVRRLGKADGRALILYRWEPVSPSGDTQHDG